MDQIAESGAPQRRSSGYAWLLGAVGLYLAGLLVYAETLAYTGDEGFHFLTDQLIRAGMRPYLDFCYPQVSFNNYWNVLWMNLFGESWRSIHAVTAVVAAASVLLMADFVFRRFPVPRWRLGAALAVVIVVGFNQVVVEYGPLGQAYGMCLFATVAAFRCALRAVERDGPWISLAAGFFGGVAAASSLLSAAVVPVLVLWILIKSRAGNRWAKTAAALAGAVIPFAPMIWLFVRGPYQVWFNLVQYHTTFRQLYWSETTQHDLEILTGFIDSGHALLLGLLALCGLWFAARRSSWTVGLRSEFYLCGWMSLALMGELARAHPTFPRYFLLAVPFLGALAAIGVYAIGARLLDSPRPRWPLMLLAFLMLLGLGKSLYERREMFTWPEYEEMARIVRQVTPADGTLWADEPMYFLTKKRPMPGLEFGYSHKVRLPAEKMALLHIVSEEEENRRVKSRMFSTVFTCEDDDIQSLGLNTLYGRKAELYGCTIYWGAAPPPGTEAKPDPKISAKDTRKK